MISSKSNWNGDAAFAHVKAEGWNAIRRAVLFFWQQVQHALNKSNPRPYQSPSKPGEPPRKRTGFLAASTTYELDEKQMAGRVGVLSNAAYGLFLELGTSRMAARSFIMSTLKRVLPQLQAIIKPKAA